MTTVHADSLMLNTKGPNQSFGNHVLHFFATWKISKTLGINLSVNTESNLDEAFDLSKYKNCGGDPVLLYSEKYGGSIEDHIKKEEENNLFFKDLLEGKVHLPQDFSLKGWFWNSLFLPDESIFEDLKINEHLIQEVSKRGYLKDNGCLVVHYRGTDFSTHSIGWGDLRLKEDYYEKCFSDFSSHNKINTLVIVGDEHPESLISLGKKYCTNLILEKNSYLVDWCILLFCKNLICSNSSFCYTAGWYKKNIVYQPEGFFLRYINENLSYPLYPYYGGKEAKIL